MEFGPDLAKLDAKLSPVDILTELLEPSKRINEKYHSTTFILTSGRSITGLTIAETPEAYQVLDNPLAKGKPLTIKKADVEERVKSPISLMPKGLLDRLSREEVLDLAAYIIARGQREHPIFLRAHHGHHGGKH